MHRPHRFLLLALLAACNSDPPAPRPGGQTAVQQRIDAARPVDAARPIDAARPVDAAPPPPLELRWSMPGRGVRVKSGPLRLAGALTGGRAPTLALADADVRLVDGRFAHVAPLQPGLNLFDLTVRDGTDGWTEHRGVLVGATADPRGAVAHAGRVFLGPQALARAAKLAAAQIDETDFTKQVKRGGPVRIKRFRKGPATVRVRAARGVLHAHIELPRVRVDFSAHKSVFGASFKANGAVTAKRAHAKMKIKLTAKDGRLLVRVADAEVRFEGFVFDVQNVPRAIEDWARSEVRQQVQHEAEKALEAVMVEPLQDIVGAPRHFRVFGRKVAATVHVERIRTTPAGVELRVGLSLKGPAIKRRGKALGPLVADRPSPKPSPGLALDVSEDALNRLLHVVWAGGGLDRELRGDEIKGVSLTRGTVQLTMGGAGWSDLSEPLQITTRAMLPPVARIADDGVHVVLSDVLVVLGDDSGKIVTLSARVDVGLTLSFAKLELSPKLAMTLDLDLVKAHREPISRGRVAAFAKLVGPIVSHVLKVDGIELPIPAKFRPRETSLAVHPKSGWVGLRAGL